MPLLAYTLIRDDEEIEIEVEYEPVDWTGEPRSIVDLSLDPEPDPPLTPREWNALYDRLFERP